MGKITILDVAQSAGVSVATVDRVLNHRPGVSPRTMERVEQSLVRLGYRPDPVFGFEVPTAVPGVPATVLDPRATWKDVAAYDAQAARLAGMFRDNFKNFASQVDDSVARAGPR